MMYVYIQWAGTGILKSLQSLMELSLFRLRPFVLRIGQRDRVRNACRLGTVWYDFTVLDCRHSESRILSHLMTLNTGSDRWELNVMEVIIYIAGTHCQLHGSDDHAIQEYEEDFEDYNEDESGEEEEEAEVVCNDLYLFVLAVTRNNYFAALVRGL